jgi:hypothetical protein
LALLGCRLLALSALCKGPFCVVFSGDSGHLFDPFHAQPKNCVKPQPQRSAAGVAGVLLSWLWNFLSPAEHDGDFAAGTPSVLPVPTHAAVVIGPWLLALALVLGVPRRDVSFDPHAVRSLAA